MHSFLSIFNSSILAGSSQALKDREHILNRNMGIVREGLAAAEDFFSRKHSDKFSWRRPIAGSVAFPGLKPRAWERLSPSLSGADRFCAHLREHADLMLMPSTVFAHGDGHVRVSHGRRNTAELLRDLDEYLLRF